MLRRQKHVLSQSTTPFACTLFLIASDKPTGSGATHRQLARAMRLPIPLWRECSSPHHSQLQVASEQASNDSKEHCAFHNGYVSSLKQAASPAGPFSWRKIRVPTRVGVCPEVAEVAIFSTISNPLPTHYWPHLKLDAFFFQLRSFCLRFVFFTYGGGTVRREDQTQFQDGENRRQKRPNPISVQGEL